MTEQTLVQVTGWTPRGATLPTPQAVPAAISGHTDLLPVFLDAPGTERDPTLTSNVVQGELGARVEQWTRSVSGGTFSIGMVPGIGPVRLPRAFTEYRERIPVTFVRDFVTNLSPTQTEQWRHRPERCVPVFFNSTGLGGAGVRRVPAAATGDVDTTVLLYGVNQRGRDRQGSRQIGAGSPFLHELCHAVLGVSADRYGFKAPLRGDVVANRNAIDDNHSRPWQRFTILRRGGGPIRDGDIVHLRSHYGRFVVAEGGGNDVLNADREAADQWEQFRIGNQTAPGRVVEHGHRITLKSESCGKYVVADEDRVLRVNRGHVTHWETFELNLRNGAANSAVESGALIALRTHTGHWWVAEENARSSAAEREQGFGNGVGKGLGYGGGFDIMDDADRTVMLNAYDRIQLGWISPRVVQTGERLSHTLRPASESRDAIVFWDPDVPDEWYVMEYRAHRPNVDEVPSSGMVVWWIHDQLPNNRYPVLISAADPAPIPDYRYTPSTFVPLERFRRQDLAAAFTEGEVTLPRGDGSPSRFRLHFQARGDGRMQWDNYT